MTRYDAMLGFSESAALLATISPAEKMSWPMFLAQNIHGQTAGYPEIRCDPQFDDIYFNSDHLEHFARTYAKVRLSEKEIEDRVDAFFEKRKAATTTSTEKRCNPVFERLGAVFNNAPCTDKIEIRLGKDGAIKLACEIGKLAAGHDNAANALLTLAMAFRVFKADGPPSEKEISALTSIISEYAEQAFESAEEAKWLSETLFEQLEEAEEAIRAQGRMSESSR